MTTSIRPKRHLRYPLHILLVAAAYVATASLGLLLASIGHNVTLVWPPSGIALAALLLGGLRLWPGVALGALVTSLLTGAPLAFAVGTAIGNPTAALLGYAVLRRGGVFDGSLERTSDVLALSVFGALLGAMASATLGAVNVCVHGIASWNGFGSVWLTWWMGDALGILLVAPPILTWSRRTVSRYLPSQGAELITLTLLTLLVSAALYGGWLGTATQAELRSVNYLIFPLLIWAALRFNQRIVATLILLAAVIAVGGTAHGRGPFVVGSLTENLVLLGGFVMTVTITGLLLGAAATESRLARGDLQESCDDLEQRVVARTLQLRDANSRLQAEIVQHRNTEADLRQSLKEVEDLYHRAPCGYHSMDRSGLFSRINDTELDWLGYRREELVGTLRFQDLLTIAGQNAFHDALASVGTNRTCDLELDMIRRDGSLLPALVYADIVTAANGDYLECRVTVHDISERRQADAELHKLSSAMQQSPVGVVITDVHGRIEYCNPKFYQLSGYVSDDVIGRNPRFLQSGQTPDDVYQDLWNTILSGKEWRGEFHDRKKTGEDYWCLQSISPIKNAQGVITHFVSISEDISERKHFETLIRRLAYFDPVTELPNRALFRDRLEQAAAHARRDGRPFALLYLDLDRFKTINDTLGHGVGDRLLKAAAQRIRACVRQSDTVARLGGDEFAVIVRDMQHEQEAGRIAEHLVKAFTLPYTVDDHELFVTPSIGISIYPADTDDLDTLIKNADVAMYRAKERGRGNCQFFIPEMNTHSLERLKLENDLRRALKRDELLLYYQPKIDLATATVTGAEALLRWRHPDHGLIPPEMFIPIAENNGLIEPIGRWVLDRVIRQNRAWQALGLPPVCIAANLSPVQFRSQMLATTISRLLDESGLSPEWLELEVTESMIMEHPEQAARTLSSLKTLGLAISIDDFGTGYSSLNYLKRFPVDTLKIDRSFVMDITTDADDAAIAQAVIGLAHNLRLQVIAEGVETREQYDFLRQHRCDAMQGHYVSPPLPAEEFEQFLVSGPVRPLPRQDAPALR